VLRALAGLAVGGAIGVGVVAIVVLTKFGPLVNTPRSLHGVLIVALIAVPAIIGALAAYALLGRRVR
jgi:hypothetical protein